MSGVPQLPTAPKAVLVPWRKEFVVPLGPSRRPQETMVSSVEVLGLKIQAWMVRGELPVRFDGATGPVITSPPEKVTPLTPPMLATTGATSVAKARPRVPVLLQDDRAPVGSSEVLRSISGVAEEVPGLLAPLVGLVERAISR